MLLLTLLLAALKVHLSNDHDGRLAPWATRNAKAAVQFYVWTRQNPTEYQLVHSGIQPGINCTNFNPNHPTKIIIHGYQDNGKAKWARDIRDEYLTREDMNIISVDWSNLDTRLLYDAAVNARQVAKVTANLIDEMYDMGTPLENIHVIGFSLGAQVTSFIQRNMKSGKLERITGLDPAKPYFEIFLNESERLDSSDANFVDVIHTTRLIQGYKEGIGHADFFPNNADVMPGCGSDILGACSHRKAHAYFIESINSNEGFRAVGCGSWRSFTLRDCSDQEYILMGDPCPKTARGNFYLYTNPSSPYAKGEKGILRDK